MSSLNFANNIPFFKKAEFFFCLLPQLLFTTKEEEWALAKAKGIRSII